MLLSTREEDEWSWVSDDSPAKDLYGELQLTAKRFSDLAHRLQEKATTKQKVWKVDQSAQTDSCCDELKMQLMESRAENMRLRQNLKDVTDINRRWHEYNNTRQKHVHYLQASLVELRETVAALRQKRDADADYSQSEEGPATSTMKKIASGRDWPSSMAKKNEDRAERRSPKSAPSSPGRTSLHKQKTPMKHGQSSEKLTSLCTDILTENVKLSRHVQELQPQVANLRHRLQTSQEECEVLRIQLKTYRNDWKSEQIEKEEALAKIRQINEELSALKLKCHHYIDKIHISKASSECFCGKGRRLYETEKNLDLQELLRSKVIEMNNRRRQRHQQPEAIMCTVDGVQVRLLERCSGDPLVSENDYDRQLQNSTDPIVTFPSSDSCNTDADEENSETPSPMCAEVNQTLLCPLCSMPFQEQCIEELLDHYKECKNFPSNSS